MQDFFNKLYLKYEFLAFGILAVITPSALMLVSS